MGLGENLTPFLYNKIGFNVIYIKKILFFYIEYNIVCVHVFY